MSKEFSRDLPFLQTERLLEGRTFMSYQSNALMNSLIANVLLVYSEMRKIFNEARA